MLVYEVTVGTTARDVVGNIVNEAGTPIDISGGTAYLRGESADLPGVYLNEVCVVTDDASGTITLPAVGTYLTTAQLGARDKATFSCQFFYSDGSGGTDYSEPFDITFRAPPVPTFTLTVTHTEGGDHEVTLSPSGGSYLAGTVVTLTASGSTFASWGGADVADLSAVTSPATIEMDADKVISAVFT